MKAEVKPSQTPTVHMVGLSAVWLALSRKKQVWTSLEFVVCAACHVLCCFCSVQLDAVLRSFELTSLSRAGPCSISCALGGLDCSTRGYFSRGGP